MARRCVDCGRQLANRVGRPRLRCARCETRLKIGTKPAPAPPPPAKRRTSREW